MKCKRKTIPMLFEEKDSSLLTFFLYCSRATRSTFRNGTDSLLRCCFLNYFCFAIFFLDVFFLACFRFCGWPQFSLFLRCGIKCLPQNFFFPLLYRQYRSR
ncbi:hypothetical protein NA56DRAFT_271945 [Hyaloscypha hepaticicola]|uniref:Uncharacterized protein n=1 Tax=Hyaloscypha hepaticicola TaxID=2082293 RepID=A0A2J6PU66_9HELO|nr:hypothetical protein NA56DRAFT_271945 [Hyaloscypha hepaticicola]